MLLGGAAFADAAVRRPVRSQQHVVICHALGNGGWVRLYPAVDDVVNVPGHGGHPGDIIPPFDYLLANGTTGRFGGLNWDAEGQAIWTNGCVRPPPPHPEQIVALVTCVDVGASTYDVTFGYQSNNTTDVSIAISTSNGFSPPPINRGQVTTFHPGTVNTAFSVRAIPIGTDLTWSVSYAGHTSIATASSSFAVSCTPRPTPAVGVFVRCVTNHGSTYDATFGYQNESASIAVIPVGPSNLFEPSPEDRGQPASFRPGNVESAFTVTGVPAADDLVWRLTSDETRTATVSAHFETKCSEPQPPVSPIGIFVNCVANHGATYDAVFGYESDNLVGETIPIGDGNAFSPPPQDRGQPTLFLPGRFEEAVIVNGIPAPVPLTWTLAFAGTRTATASAAFATKCSEPIEPPEVPGPEPPEPPGPKPPDPPGPQPPVPPRPLGIFAACITNHGRSYDATFGYVNENAGDVVIPIGSPNRVRPGRDDQGQPRTFRPGFVDAAFTVRGVNAAQSVSWRIAFGGQIRLATATATFANKCRTGTIDPVADVSVTKSATPTTAALGQTVAFTIIVRNNGSRALSHVDVVDSLPIPQLEVISVRAVGGSCRTATTPTRERITCTAPTLAPGQAFTIRIVARATAPGTATDRASILSPPNDSTPGDNVASATVKILQPPPPPSGPGLGLGLGLGLG
jgi:uncharacterized repeat protein (TIGR01451 family)